MTDQLEASNSSTGAISAREERKQHAREQQQRRQEAIRAREASSAARRRHDHPVMQNNHYGEASSCQSCNDRRDTDHGGRRTATLVAPDGEMDAEAVAGETKWELQEDGNGWEGWLYRIPKS
ncbi:hypothetical protein Scep_024411 [Stephania cephalantha]|uniref:Uncharacterized protein n=1 Tax=Stephania cephalantha TaxID=152367 RepID=A0AAP0HY89_9MAGN